MTPTRTLAILCCLALSGCGDSQNRQSATQSAPVRTACTTPEQAGTKAADITRKLVEARKQGKINADQYAALNTVMSNGFRAWGEHQDLRAYCAALDRVVSDPVLQ